jgi:hypothetical protein
MDNIKTHEQEKAELNTLINKGITFEITDVEFQEKPMFFGFIKKHIPVKATKQFKIRELTLGTLDRLSAEWIECNIDEAELKSGNGMQQAKTLTRKHALRCARIIAIAVMDADFLIPKYKKNGSIRYVEDTNRMEELTALFAHALKPSQLYRLTLLVNTMCNLGDFVNSIRLMCASRTTMPVRIEANRED